MSTITRRIINLKRNGAIMISARHFYCRGRIGSVQCSPGKISNHNTIVSNAGIKSNKLMLFSRQGRRWMTTESSSKSLPSKEVDWGARFKFMFFGGLCAGTFYLGCWQSKRFFEKQTGIEERNRQLQEVPISQWCTETFKNTPFRRYTLQGRFHYDQEIFIGPRALPPGTIPENNTSSPGSGGGGLSTSPQGYFVLTPFQIENNGNSSGEDSPTPKFVMVNRGWIPKEFAPTNTKKMKGAARLKADTPGHEGSKILWEQPKGTVQITVLPSETEEPKYFAIQHNEQSNVLFYMDKIAFSQKLDEASNNTKGKDVWLFTQILHEINNESSTDEKQPKVRYSTNFPLQPSKDKVGEYKITPAIHAGYAVTWFGLSGAGVIMTRKLLTRGK